jgi:hypothetical protein
VREPVLHDFRSGSLPLPAQAPPQRAAVLQTSPMPIAGIEHVLSASDVNLLTCLEALLVLVLPVFPQLGRYITGPACRP